MRVTIDRIYKERVTLGEMNIFYPETKLSCTPANRKAAVEAGIFSADIFRTVELPWKDNQNNISCIPEGTYDVIPRWSPGKGQHFHILHVPGRSFILFHIANYFHQLQGCIAPGMEHLDLDGDGVMDVNYSRKTMNRLIRLCPDGFRLKIRKRQSFITEFLDATRGYD